MRWRVGWKWREGRREGRGVQSGERLRCVVERREWRWHRPCWIEAEDVEHVAEVESRSLNTQLDLAHSEALK